MRTFLRQLAYTLFMFVAIAQQGFAQNVDVFIGTSGKDGIFHLTLNTDNGKLSEPKLFAEIEGSGFLAQHPTLDVLYSTMKKDGDAGVVSISSSVGGTIKRSKALKEIQKLLEEQEAQLDEITARLGKRHPDVESTKEKITALEAMKETAFSVKNTELNFVSSGDGGSACVGTDRSGKALFSAQYGGGSTTSYLLADDGKIVKRVSLVEHGPGSAVNEKRQSKSHPHWVGTSPDNCFLMVPDLGKDAVVVYSLDSENASIEKHSEVAVPPGAGPRHMKFHQNKKHAYVLNELALTISVFEYDAEAAGFKGIQVIETLPEDQKDKHLNSAAEIRIHPNGKFVYSSNRGHDSISVFSVDPATGKLTFVEREHVRGSWPRNFNIDPSGKWLIAAGQYSNTLSLFEIDQESGELIFARKCVNVPKPICVLFAR